MIKLKKENYIYPAIFDYTDDGFINISFYDFPECITFAETDELAIKSARDILGLTLVEYEQQGLELPNCTEPSKINIKPKQKLVFIDIWMPYFRNQVKETYVKKTLTIPAWLDILAKQNNINFSSILVRGLKEELNIDK